MGKYKLARAHFAVALCLIISLHATYTEGAQTQEAEGVAAIGTGGRDEARQAALHDALQQAALSVGAQVTGTERMNTADAPLQSLHVRPTQQIGHYLILREWENQGLYHVVVSAEAGQGRVAGECAARADAPKKKVAFIPFGVITSIQVDDINNAFDGLPTEISHRLEASGGYLAIYDRRSIPTVDSPEQREAIMRFVKESGAQFLVSGTIVNAQGIPGIPEFFWAQLGSRYRKRHFEIEFSVYDGLTGTRVSLRRLDEYVEGDVMVGRDKPFGSRAFFETVLGQAVNRLMDAAAKDIRATLECLPFSANIVRVEGKKVFLDAGSTSLLRPGDKLIAYSKGLHRIVGMGNTESLGIEERPVATVTLSKVQPQFSVGDLSEGTAKLGINVGDTVRFEFIDNN